jgi:hypothetical protein
MTFFNPGCVAAPLGDFGKLLQAAPANTTSISNANDIAQRGRRLFIHTPLPNSSASNISPSPPPIPPGFGLKAGTFAVQNVFTTIATCVVPFPVSVTEPGWIEHVTDGSVGSEHVSVTVGSSLSPHHCRKLLDKIVLQRQGPGGGMAYAGDLKSFFAFLHATARKCKQLKTQ